MKYRIDRDGSWSVFGKHFSLENIYPHINGTNVHPVRVQTGDSEIRYFMVEGLLICRLSETENGLKITSVLKSRPGTLNIDPVGECRVAFHSDPISEKPRVFIQGFGMEGPSGIYSPEDEPPVSNGLIALTDGENNLFLYAEEHRKYINRYRIRKETPCFSESSDSRFCLSGGFDLEGTAREEVQLPDLFLFETQHQSLSDGLRYCAEKIAHCMQARSGMPPAYHWCSWYYQYQNMSQKILEDYMECFPAAEPLFRYIQIDAGYCPHPGDWLTPNHLYPDGLKKAAQTIMDAGYTPGIWIGPFIVGDQSALYLEHPDWVLKGSDGKPFVQMRSYNEPKAWACPDCDYYVLDTSHPEALHYLEDVFRTLYSWGYRLFKTDFMLWSMHSTAAVRRYDPSLTSVEIMRNTLHTIRNAIGEESYLLGCIAPFLPFIGYADGMRIAGDVGAQWSGAYGPENLLREIQADSYFQNLYWQNDPDSVLLRDYHIFLSPREIESLALLQAVSGGAVTVSDPVHELPECRRELLSFIRPSGVASGAITPALPLYGRDKKHIIFSQKLANGMVLFFLNPTDEPVTIAHSFAEVTGVDEWYTYEKGSLPDPAKKPCSCIIKELLSHESLLLFLTKKPLDKIPQSLWF